jgi:hypothetical protein
MLLSKLQKDGLIKLNPTDVRFVVAIKVPPTPVAVTS